jgi:hypothetical protein
MRTHSISISPFVTLQMFSMTVTIVLAIVGKRYLERSISADTIKKSNGKTPLSQQQDLSIFFVSMTYPYFTQVVCQDKTRRTLVCVNGRSKEAYVCWTRGSFSKESNFLPLLLGNYTQTSVREGWRDPRELTRTVIRFTKLRISFVSGPMVSLNSYTSTLLYIKDQKVAPNGLIDY